MARPSSVVLRIDAPPSTGLDTGAANGAHSRAASTPAASASVGGGAGGVVSARQRGRGGHGRIGFTCGHSFKLRDFQQTIIPRFERRMEEMGLSVSGRLMVADYNLERTGLACPSCVLDAIKADVVRVKRRSILHGTRAMQLRTQLLSHGHGSGSSGTPAGGLGFAAMLSPLLSGNASGMMASTRSSGSQPPNSGDLPAGSVGSKGSSSRSATTASRRS